MTTDTTSSREDDAADVTFVSSGKAELALHHLRRGEGRPLLLLHGLAERTPDAVPAHLAEWPGPVVGLDFTGHGRSTVPAGGGYTSEALMADADSALVEIGPATVLGRGLGAYIALLIAGARPDLVRGAILADGPGLVGGGIRPSSPQLVPLDPDQPAVPDPHALAELSRDVRPPDYAAEFVRMALRSSELDAPIAVAAVVRPEWLAGVVAEYGVIELPLGQALARYAALD
ncbi:MAG: alpha/beta fold hydrolase [Acidimicrobiales bacterium]